MAIISENQEQKDNKGEGEKVRQWLQEIQKSLNFIYHNKPQELSVEEACSGNAKYKIFDPYSDLSANHLKERIVEVIGVRSKSRELEKLCGRDCVVKLKNGEELNGAWREGKREGLGALYSPRLEKIGVEHLSGYYDDGVLSGQGRLFMNNTTIRDGWFEFGYCHGPFRGMTLGGQLDYIGWYLAGTPAGFTWQSIRGDGWLFGKPDKTGKFSGEDIAYIYPDLQTAILGKFDDGLLVCGKPAKIVSTDIINGVLVPKFKITSEKIFQRWISTNKDIACPPHLCDPYESGLVEVKVSNVAEGSGEGLYAKVDIPENRIISYYNGLRFEKHESLDPETGYDIYLELNHRKDKNAKHCDIPVKYQSHKDYSSTLAHKMNHSFEPTCVWDNAEHPVHGLVPCVRTLQPIKAGSELTIHYCMDMESSPEWYMDEWERHGIRKREEMLQNQ